MQSRGVQQSERSRAHRVDDILLGERCSDCTFLYNHAIYVASLGTTPSTESSRLSHADDLSFELLTIVVVLFSVVGDDLSLVQMSSPVRGAMAHQTVCPKSRYRLVIHRL